MADAICGTGTGSLVTLPPFTWASTAIRCLPLAYTGQSLIVVATAPIRNWPGISSANERAASKPVQWQADRILDAAHEPHAEVGLLGHDRFSLCLPHHSIDLGLGQTADSSPHPPLVDPVGCRRPSRRGHCSAKDCLLKIDRKGPLLHNTGVLKRDAAGIREGGRFISGWSTIQVREAYCRAEQVRERARWVRIEDLG